MKINFKNPGHIKLMLLSEGVDFDESVLSNVGIKYSENRYYYNVSNDPKKFKNQIPSEILLPEDVESSIYYNPESKFKIKNKGDKILLFYKENFICEILFNSRPYFFDKKINSEVNCQKVISMYGRYILAIFPNAHCFLFNEGLQCKFCSLKPSRKTFGKDNLSFISSEIIKKAIKIAVKHDGERIKYVMYTSGTNMNPDVSYKEHINIIRAIKPLLEKKVIHHVTATPTLNQNLLQETLDSGFKSIAFDLEVFDKKIFQKLCPGKERYFGYDMFLESFKMARKVFGKNNIKVGFVGGLEPIDSLIEGMDFFAKLGVSIAINVFHPDLNTELEGNPRPSADYLMEMVKAQTKICKKYKLIPVFPIGGRRSSLDTEVYKGFFN